MSRIPAAERLSTSICDGLQYTTGLDGGGCHSLPQWTHFLVKLGSLLVSQDNTSNRVVAALAMPTRAYAAAFAALGVVVARSLTPHTHLGWQEHLRHLDLLAREAPVIIRRHNHELKGHFLGRRETGGRPTVGVKIENNTAIWVNVEDCERIRISKESFSLPKHQSGRITEHASAFLTAMLGESPSETFVTKARLECLLVGRMNILVYEIRETHIVFQTREGTPVTGTLQDVLRVRRLSKDGAYRSHIVPFSHSAAPIGDEIPAVVIFDGARGYLKWRHHWREPHCIVLLDRTEASFSEAVEAINQDYIKNRAGNEWTKKRLPPVPPSIEAMVYEEARR